MKLTMKGQRRAIRKFRRLDDALQDEIAGDAVMKAARPILKDAVAEAPKVTGQLSEAIRLVKRGTKRAIRADVEIGAGMFKGKTFYGAFVELGTEKMAARPFLRPAIDKNRSLSRQLAARHIARRINALAK